MAEQPDASQVPADPPPDETVDPAPSEAAEDPGYASVLDYLLYGVSLPERMIRSTAATAAGTLRESSRLLVPKAFQNSKTYTSFVKQMLDFVAEDVGGVRREEQAADPQIENFVARKAVGNFLEMAGMFTMRASPILILAVASDVAYGSRAYLRELADELKQKGVIDEDSTINHVDDLLSAVADTTGGAATAVNTPPLSVDELRKTVDEVRTAATSADPTKVFPQAEMQRMWDEMKGLAERDNVGMIEVSTGMAMFSLQRLGQVGKGAYATVQTAGLLVDRVILDHYWEAVSEIRDKGLYATVAEAADPYLDAVWDNFSWQRTTITRDVLTGRMFSKAWGAVKGFWSKPEAEDCPPAGAADDSVSESQSD